MEAHNLVKINFDISEETLRCSFVPHLSAALGRKGMSVLSDKHNQSYKSIASVFVFSENYLFSKESLDEVVETIHRRRHYKGHVVTAIFYGVNRSNYVQEMMGNFSKAFEEHHASDQASQWYNALAEITSLPGYETSDRQSDYKFMENFAREVYEMIFPNERIGIYSRMLPRIENLLHKQQGGVRRLGIWGMPGIGKTKLAKAFFDQMSGAYEVTCFVQNFHETFQEKGLYGLLVEHFKNLPNKTLQLRVLVVLDDVRNHLEAESFLGEFFLFSPGSLIIITSRDEQVFSQCEVNQTYKVEGLSKQESQKLFSWCTFGRDVRENDHVTELSMQVVDYANGNPLALRIYGEEMSSQEQSNKKEALFLKLKQAPPQQIMEVVKSSYYALNDNEKNILVYIAFFFTGYNVDSVSEVLQDLNLFPHIGIDRLVENSLVTISENRLEMHSMIQAVVREMGRCHKLKLSEGTRFKCVLGTEDIEAISLDASNLNPDIKISSLKYMYNLRFLKIYYSDSENINHKALESLSYGLRVLHWENYPLQSLPQDFNTSNLVDLSMPNSQLQTLGRGTNNLKMLKRINLCNSQKLVEVDEISEALNLEKIDLSGCKNLQSFPEIHKLQNLRHVDLSGCTQIKSFPEFPSSVILKFKGASINKFVSPVTHTIKSLYELLDNQRNPLKLDPQILDSTKLRSFPSIQEKEINTGRVEGTFTFKDMMFERALMMTRSTSKITRIVQEKLANIPGFQIVEFKIRSFENLGFKNLNKESFSFLSP